MKKVLLKFLRFLLSLCHTISVSVDEEKSQSETSDKEEKK